MNNVSDWKVEAKRRFASSGIPPYLSVTYIYELIDGLDTKLHRAMVKHYQRALPLTKTNRKEWAQSYAILASIARGALSMWLLDRPDFQSWSPKRSHGQGREIHAVASVLADMTEEELDQALEVALKAYGVPLHRQAFMNRWMVELTHS